MIIQLCGLSGAGKTTISNLVVKKLKKKGLPIYLIDCDYYRKTICRDLGFSEPDRKENVRRMAFVADKLSQFGIITIIAAINPYDDVREEIKQLYVNVKLIYICCDMKILIERDTKGLYKRAMLPDNASDKLNNLTGVNAPFEIPTKADLTIYTTNENEEVSAELLFQYICSFY